MMASEKYEALTPNNVSLQERDFLIKLRDKGIVGYLKDFATFKHFESKISDEISIDDKTLFENRILELEKKFGFKWNKLLKVEFSMDEGNYGAMAHLDMFTGKITLYKGFTNKTKWEDVSPILPTYNEALDVLSIYKEKGSVKGFTGVQLRKIEKNVLEYEKSLEDDLFVSYGTLYHIFSEYDRRKDSLLSQLSEGTLDVKRSSYISTDKFLKDNGAPISARMKFFQGFWFDSTLNPNKSVIAIEFKKAKNPEYKNLLMEFYGKILE